MSRHNGRPPFFIPGSMPAPQPTGISVSAPFNDQQLLCLMAASQLANVPVPEDPTHRSAQAAGAVLRSLDILGQVMYQLARGQITAVARQAVAAGEIDAKAALEAEPSHQEPPPASADPQPAPVKIEIADR